MDSPPPPIHTALALVTPSARQRVSESASRRHWWSGVGCLGVVVSCWWGSEPQTEPRGVRIQRRYKIPDTRTTRYTLGAVSLCSPFALFVFALPANCCVPSCCFSLFFLCGVFFFTFWFFVFFFLFPNYTNKMAGADWCCCCCCCLWGLYTRSHRPRATCPGSRPACLSLNRSRESSRRVMVIKKVFLSATAADRNGSKWIGQYI